MSLKNYSNNDKNPVSVVYSPIAFSNAESKIMASRFSISYFNRLMKVSIALRNNAGSNDAYATYDTDNQVSVYVSATKAKMLADMIVKMISNPTEINNVCIELKNGLLKVSNGAEYGVNNTCISISYADESGNVNEVVYENKADFYSAAYNYSDGEYSTEVFKSMELDMFVMTLNEYYKASSYAVVASIGEGMLYKRDAQYNLIKAIAEKVGVSGNNKQFNNKTFLSGGNNKTTSSGINGIPAEYESASFASIAGEINQ